MQMQISQTLKNLSSLEHEQKHCFFVYLKIIALPFLAYLYFVLGYAGAIKLQVGLHSIMLIGLIFAVSLLFARHNAEFGACFFKRHSREFKIELGEYIQENLMRIGSEVKSNASFEKFVDQYSKRIRNENYASVASSIFPTMGILGTFISIAVTLPDFSSQTANALEREISTLLGGVGTAFYVSIYGILLSLWWIFFEKRGLSRFDKDIELIKEGVEELFWTKEAIEQAYLKENLQHFEKIGKMFEQLSSSDFFERLGKTIEDKFDLFDKMLKLEAASVKKGAEHLKDGMDALARSQESQINLGRIHESILASLNQFNENTVELHTKMRIDQHDMLEINHEILQALKDANKPTKAEIYARSEEVESLKESLKMIDAETEQIILKMDALKQ